MYNKLLAFVVLTCAFFFLYCAKANAQSVLPRHPIDCANTYDNDGCYEHPECCAIAPLIHMDEFEGVREYTCNPKVNGDCSREGLDILSDNGVFITIINDDTEYGCDDTSCRCEWQECFKPAADTGYILGE